MLPELARDDFAGSWTPATLHRLNDYFECESPRALLAWSYDLFGSDMVMGTGFGPSGILLSYFVSQVRADITLFYLDTDLLFPQTYALRDALSARLGIRFTRVSSGFSLAAQEAEHGPSLWKRNPDACCRLRKVEPLRRFLQPYRAWVTGVRRDQAPTRANTRLLEWNAAYDVVKINPLAHWTEDDVWCHLHLHDLPYNQLHDAGYDSIGCQPCTSPAAGVEGRRTGRWRGREKTECGIHLSHARSEGRP